MNQDKTYKPNLFKRLVHGMACIKPIHSWTDFLQHPSFRHVRTEHGEDAAPGAFQACHKRAFCEFILLLLSELLLHFQPLQTMQTLRLWADRDEDSPLKKFACQEIREFNLLNL